MSAPRVTIILPTGKHVKMRRADALPLLPYLSGKPVPLVHPAAECRSPLATPDAEIVPTPQPTMNPINIIETDNIDSLPEPLRLLVLFELLRKIRSEIHLMTPQSLDFLSEKLTGREFSEHPGTADCRKFIVLLRDFRQKVEADCEPLGPRQPEGLAS